jgi:glycosyltransferase involved in cell wall biosynthesis
MIDLPDMPNSSQKLNVLQFISSTGFYGAERWILALINNSNPSKVRFDLAVTSEKTSNNLAVIQKFQGGAPTSGDIFEIPMSYRFDPRVINRLVRIIHDRKINIIHTHGYKSDIIGVIAAKKAGIKSVVTPHGFENATDLKLKLFIWLGCKAMKYADIVAPLSSQIVDDVKGFGIANSHIFYIHNGVDLSEVDEVYLNPSISGSSNNTKRIGFIGQMISRKNIVDIIDTFELLKSRHKNIELILLGDGDQRKELESLAKKLPNGDSIQFLGFRDDRLVYLKRFDLFAMTSTLEGIPRCLMEAMAMGIPVAAYDIPGVDQLIEHGKTGLLAPLGNKSLLAEQWEKLLFDEKFSKTIAENARAFVFSQYSAKRMANEYLELYQKLHS